jgi:hypothetical protein
VLESTVVPQWIARVLRELERRDFIELTHALVDAPTAPTPGPLYALYERADRWWYDAADHPLEPAPVDAPLATVPRVDLEAASPGELEDLDLDLWVWLVPREVPPHLPPTARYGVWAHRFGDGSPRAPFFRELYEGTPLAIASLDLHAGEETDPKRLYSSCAATHLRSLDQTRRETFWKASSFLPRRLDDLRERGWDPAQAPICEGSPQADEGTPGTLEMIFFLARLALRFARHKLGRLIYRGPYLVALGSRVDGDAERAARDFAVVPAPAGRFYADPFLVAGNDADYLFVEDADTVTGNAVISCLEIHPGGAFAAPRMVLERPPHVSYPCVFRWKDDYFMIPETVRSRTVELYRALEFPWRWERVKLLFDDVSAVDTTFFDHGGRCWLFTAMSECGGSLNDELFLFHADSPLGPWTPHPMNPVVSDVRRARPAGSVYADGGELIRPGQDCSRIYGGAIVLNRIDALTVKEYREQPVRRIDPTWRPGLVGTHTLNHGGRFTVLDGKHRVPKWRS